MPWAEAKRLTADDKAFISYALGFLDAKSGSVGFSESERYVYGEIAKLIRELTGISA